MDRYRDPGMDRPVTYVREPQMPPAHGYGREPERYDDRDTRWDMLKYLLSHLGVWGRG